MEETKLRQLFKNRADAYLNTIDESVEQGMSEDCFINAINEAINYTHSCKELKDKETISFRDWVNQNKYTRFGNGYQRNEIVFSKEEMWQRFENRN